MRLLQSIHNFDLATFDWCLRRKRREALVTASRVISKTGDGPLYFLTAAPVALAGYIHTIPVFLAAFAVERTIYTLAKKFFKRNRPPQAIPNFQPVVIPSDQFSFPSGHTSAAFLMTIMLTSLAPVLAFVLLPWALAIGASRVMLGVHFPTDILAGASLGSVCGFAALTYLMPLFV